MPFGDGSLWMLLFNETPTPVRYVLGILTLGIFTMARHIWNRNQVRLISIELREKNYATKPDIAEVNKRIEVVHSDVKKIMFHLMKDSGE